MDYFMVIFSFDSDGHYDSFYGKSFIKIFLKFSFFCRVQKKIFLKTWGWVNIDKCVHFFLSSYTHPYVVSNMYDFFSLLEHNGSYF